MKRKTASRTVEEKERNTAIKKGLNRGRESDEETTMSGIHYGIQ